jgi:hypothetical protein
MKPFTSELDVQNPKLVHCLTQVASSDAACPSVELPQNAEKQKV